MIRIDSGYFVAGAEVQNGIVIRTAPIIKYMKGWTIEKVIAYSKKKEWKCD